MPKFRKKPVVIEAFRFTGWTSSVSRYPEWFMEADGIVAIGANILWKDFENVPPFDCAAIIPTLEGNHRADYGDYIIKGIKGELYPCKPDIFEATYDRVE